ncbi:hypothetical protein ACJMK2_021367 [Sinanodonta woodiana]|uniref:TIR domain-containing protein n=1 Tax=Sinanodonta woodiana TaxID=1069815 RepID=A0ABD3TH03_SINWO
MKNLLCSCLLLIILYDVHASQCEVRDIRYISRNVCKLCRCASDESNTLAVDCKMRHLSCVLFRISSKVTSLDLSKNNITILKNDSFTGLSNLRNLDLSYNRIDFIEIGTFWPLKALENLWLVETNLGLLQAALRQGLFRGLLNLRCVKLQGTINEGLANLSRLPDETFSDLLGLEELTIDGTFGLRFGPGFENLTNFKTLTMSGWIGHCNIGRLDSETFIYVPYLQHIKITKCQLSHIASDAFKSLTNLNTLDLSENVGLGFDNFGRSFEALKHTSITVLDVTSIVSPYGKGTILSLDDVQHLHETKLEEVYLDRNALESIEDGVLSKFPPTLRKLYFRENRLLFTLFMYEIFKLDNLLIFDAGNQQHITSSNTRRRTQKQVRVEYSDKPKPGCKTSMDLKYAQNKRNDTTSRRISPKIYVVWTDLHNNNLQIHVEKNPSYLNVLVKDSNVTTQNLSYFFQKPDTTISNQNKDVIQRRKQSAIKNNATNLKSNLSVTTPSLKMALTTFICSGSESNFVFLNFSGVDNNIRYIDISGNFIPVLNNSSFAGLSKVEFLTLSNNHIVNLEPLTFVPLHSLIYLDLSNNNLGNSYKETAWNSFESLHSLQTIDISGNSISHLPQHTFQSMRYLQALDAKFNDLNDFDVNLENSALLRTLDLSNNRLPYLKTNIMHYLDHLAKDCSISLDLTGNNLLCTCKTLPFLRWLRTTNVTLINKSQYFCSLENGSIRYINESTLVNLLESSCKSYTIFYISGAIGGTFALSFSIFFLVYRNRWKLRYLYYMTKLKLPKTPAANTEDVYANTGFVSYDENDIRFVKNCMIPELEVNRGHKLVIKDRDFLPGEVLASTILKAIRESRKTISLISRESLQNKWWTFELHMAQIESIYMNRNVLILIFIEDIPVQDLPVYVLDLLQFVTCIKFHFVKQTESAFWNELHEYMIER